MYPPLWQRDQVDSPRSSNIPLPASRPLSYGLGQRTISIDHADHQLSRMPAYFQAPYPQSSSNVSYGSLQTPSEPMEYLSRPGYLDTASRQPISANIHPQDITYTMPQDSRECVKQGSPKRNTVTDADPSGDERRYKKFRGGRDEFEGSVQFLQKPHRSMPEPRDRDLPLLPTHLDTLEQDDILTQVNKSLSRCAFDFVALYRFPIPIEPNKPAVQGATDKAWTEWAYLLKRLATKRRIPSHAIFQGQIKELTTVLDNSLEMRHATKPHPRPLKDDRTVLQFISAGIQVGKMLKDAKTMEYLDTLYKQTERLIQGRKEPGPSGK